MPNYTDPAELLTIVDSNDKPIGAERRYIIHRDGLLHRAIHLFIFRPTGELLLQQRSAKKDMYPLHWECIGGHVAPGDSYEVTALREALEEAGLHLSAITELKKLPAGPATDQEFITVYTATSDQEIRSNPEEVIAVEWLPPARWQEEIIRNVRLFSPTLLNTLQFCPEILSSKIY